MKPCRKMLDHYVGVYERFAEENIIAKDFSLEAMLIHKEIAEMVRLAHEICCISAEMAEGAEVECGQGGLERSARKAAPAVKPVGQ